MVGRGKNYSKQDEEQLCRSFLHIGHGYDRIAGGTGQKLAAFWERVAAHYNESTPPGSEVRPVRSLESKWSLIKGEVSKFSDFYDSTQPVDELGTSRKDVIAKALELYQTAAGNAKQEDFKFLHCWEILKDHPKWASLGEAQLVKAGEPSKKPGKRRRNSEEAENSSSAAPTEEFPGVREIDREIQDEAEAPAFEIISHQQQPVAEGNGGVPSFEDVSKQQLRLEGDGAASAGAAVAAGGKEGPEAEAQVESGRMAQARAASDLARAKLEKTRILKDQFLLQLFSTEVDEGDRELNKEYLRLRKEEELDEIRARVAKRRLEKASTALS